MSLSPNWFITTPGGRWSASELASYQSMTFTLGMNDDSSRLTAEILVWENLLGTFVGWDYTVLGVWVNLLQDSSGIGLDDKTVGFWWGSELGSTLWVMLDYETWPPVDLLFIVYIPLGSNVRSPELMVSNLQDTLEVPPSWYCPKLLPPSSRICLTSTSQATLYVTICGGNTFPIGNMDIVVTSMNPKAIRS